MRPCRTTPGPAEESELLLSVDEGFGPGRRRVRSPAEEKEKGAGGVAVGQVDGLLGDVAVDPPTLGVAAEDRLGVRVADVELDLRPAAAVVVDGVGGAREAVEKEELRLPHPRLKSGRA